MKLPDSHNNGADEVVTMTIPPTGKTFPDLSYYCYPSLVCHPLTIHFSLPVYMKAIFKLDHRYIYISKEKAQNFIQEHEIN